MPILRELTPKEYKQLEQLAEYKAQEAKQIEWAEEHLLSYSNIEYKAILDEGIHLIANIEKYRKDSDEGTVIIRNNFPQGLLFLNPYAVYISEHSCMILLQKGIGKSIGYSISKENDLWKISSFNEYISWDRTEIDLSDY